MLRPQTPTSRPSAWAVNSASPGRSNRFAPVAHSSTSRRTRRVPACSLSASKASRPLGNTSVRRSIIAATIGLGRVAVALHRPHRSAVGYTRSSSRSRIAPEPLKRLGPMSIHRVHDHLIDRDQGEPRRELLDPLTSVVPEDDAFRQLEDPVHAVLFMKAPVAVDVPLVLLYPQIADVQQPIRTENPTDLSNDSPLFVITRDAGQDRE